MSLYQLYAIQHLGNNDSRVVTPHSLENNVRGRIAFCTSNREEDYYFFSHTCRESIVNEIERVEKLLNLLGKLDRRYFIIEVIEQERLSPSEAEKIVLILTDTISRLGITSLEVYINPESERQSFIFRTTLTCDSFLDYNYKIVLSLLFFMLRFAKETILLNSTNKRDKEKVFDNFCRKLCTNPPLKEMAIDSFFTCLFIYFLEIEKISFSFIIWRRYVHTHYYNGPGTFISQGMTSFSLCGEIGREILILINRYLKYSGIFGGEKEPLICPKYLSSIRASRPVNFMDYMKEFQEKEEEKPIVSTTGFYSTSW